jgi:hypothetical protein
LPYHFGINPVAQVVKEGRLVFEAGGDRT